jgi:valyl-tRNA synthetase
MNPPDRPTLDGLEAHWAARWEADGTYAFDRTASRPDVYAVDTPPPTVSGSLHVGHVFSFTHTDTVARYQRMRGRAVFYPMGWDDNGLPTERRVQQHFGVRCDPSLPYEGPGFTPDGSARDADVAVSRPTFVALCERLTAEDERVFEALFRRLGLSVDWSLGYTTIGRRARRVAQRAFLRNLARGEAYQLDAPTLWDVDFGTAVAQAELEDRDTAGAWYTLDFGGVRVDTTRPELLPACVALVCHPDDERYAALVGGTVRTPLFGVDVPVYAHPLASPDRGTGVAMVCTFGDLNDVTWWRELDLPVRAVVGRDGRLVADPPSGVDAAAYAPLAGLTTRQARRRVAELLNAGPRPVTHAVKYYERGSSPLEIVTTRQWYLRNGGRDPALRADLLARGGALDWHPPHMRTRYDDWVGGLAGDWLVSRQRYFGVPFPVWYPVLADGTVDRATPLVPPEDALPVDPSTDVPPGYPPEQRGVPGGFVGDPDVLDTWATSSLTPQIAGGWEDDPALFAAVYPMDLRPQSHEIIRTWLFATVVRAHLEDGTLPWRDVAISGWVLDPDRKKMAKSRGNAKTPDDLLDRYGSDAVRYWAAAARPGVDTAFDTAQMKVGRRLATKLLNASRFVLGLPGKPGPVTAPVDLAMLSRLASTVETVTAAYERLDHAAALDRAEEFFWWFCDDHVELVKSRAYGTDAAASSAAGALRVSLEVVLRLLAPVLPFVTEEVWSWWREGSVHRAPWPSAPEIRPQQLVVTELPAAVSWVLAAVRKAKSDARVSVRAGVSTLDVRADGATLDALRAARDDLAAAAVADQVRLRPGDAAVEVVLA